MTLVPSEQQDPRLERFLSLQAGQYWRANEAIPSEAIEAGWVLLIQSVRYVDEAMHTVVLRAHPSVFGKEVVKRTERGGETHESRVTAGEHRFLVGDFETLFTYEPDHRAVRDAEMKAVQGRVREIQDELMRAQSDPAVLEGVVEKTLAEEAADRGGAGLPALSDGRVDVVALAAGSMVATVGPGLTEAGVERMRDAARREHRIATIRANWIQGRTDEMARTIAALTPFYHEHAAAALAQTEDVRERVDKLLKGIETLDLYVGKDVAVTTIREGDHAPRSEPLTFVQRKLVMDEEAAVFVDVDERFDFASDKAFFEALRGHDDLVRQVFPAERCILVMAATRRNIDYGDGLVNAARNEQNHKVFLLVRDGFNIHRVVSPVESHLGAARLFPSQSDQDGLFRGLDGTKVRFEDVAFTDKLRRHDAFALHYKRFLVLCCGLDHRLKLFGDFYDGPATMGFVSQEFQDAHCRFLHDDEGDRLLGDARRPDVETWIKAMNAYGRSGSRMLCNWRRLMTPETSPSTCKYDYRNKFGDGFTRNYTPDEDMGVRIAYRSGTHVFVDVEVSGYTVSGDGKRTFNAKVDLSKAPANMSREGDLAALCLDAVEPEDLHHYIHNRAARRNHLGFIRFFKRALAYVLAEREREADARGRLLAALADGGIGTPDTRPALVKKAVLSWRAANRGAELPALTDGGGKPWRELLDQMFSLAQGEDDADRVEALAASLGVRPLRLVMTGKARLTLYAEPTETERDDRLEPQAFVRVLVIERRASGLTVKDRRWAILQGSVASETTLRQWPGSEEWIKRRTGFRSHEHKLATFKAAEDGAALLASLRGPMDRSAFDPLLQAYAKVMDAANAKASHVQRVQAVVPFAVTAGADGIEFLCATADAAAVLHRLAPDDEARAALRRAFVGQYRIAAHGRDYFDDAAGDPYPWGLGTMRVPANPTGTGLFGQHTLGTGAYEAPCKAGISPLLGDWFDAWMKRHAKRGIWVAPGVAGPDGSVTVDAALGIALEPDYEQVQAKFVTIDPSGKGGEAPRFGRFVDLGPAPTNWEAGSKWPVMPPEFEDFGKGMSTALYRSRSLARTDIVGRAKAGMRAVRAEDLPEAPQPVEDVERWFYVADAPGPVVRESERTEGP